MQCLAFFFIWLLEVGKVIFTEYRGKGRREIAIFTLFAKSLIQHLHMIKGTTMTVFQIFFEDRKSKDNYDKKKKNLYGSHL